MRQKLLQDRYFIPGETDERQIYERVSRAIYGSQDPMLQTSIYNAMEQFYWLPNTPTLVNAGRPQSGGLSACYVLPIYDSLDGIYKTVWDAARVHKSFGGTGFNFSKIRAAGTPIQSTGGRACGPLKVMELLNTSAGTVMQGGKREGANMGILNDDHPDIRQFITCKSGGQNLQHFNISVGIHDATMRSDDDLLTTIAEEAWRTGDPGLIFLDRLNEGGRHTTGHFGIPVLPDIECTNPCLTGDCRIQTVNGNIPIKYLVGQTVDVYCMNCNTYELKIARATNIHQTKIATELVHITTTWGDLTCTPEHQVYTRNRGYIAASELKLSDTLAGLQKFARNERHINVMLTGQDRSKAIAEHRFVLSHYEDITGRTVHHINGDPHDNRVENLSGMAHGKHSVLHNTGHECYCEKDPITGQFIPCSDPIKRTNKISTHKPGVNLRILKISMVVANEPVYDLTVDIYHNCIANGLVVHNCGEQPLRPYESCNLGSINLAKYPDMVDGDYSSFQDMVELSIRTLDRIIDINVFPIPEIRDATLLTRKIGSGLMGWADWLILGGISYQSPEAIKWINKIGSMYRDTAYETSHKLALQYGNYPAWGDNPHAETRNETCLTIAPTGTLSYLAGCSWGIEPVFDWDYQRDSESGSQVLTSSVYQAAKASGLLGDTAKLISPEWQIRHLAAWQQWVDNGVSKTINLPSTATVEDIIKAFKYAWQMKCKGVTVYRDGSKTKQAIKSMSSTRPEGANGGSITPTRKPPVDPTVRDGHNVERFGSTIDFRTGCGRIHVTCNERDQDSGIPFEVYILSDGGCPANNEAIGKLISKYLHDYRLAGHELETAERIVKTLRKVECPTAMQNKNSQGKSCAEIIAKRILQVWGKRAIPGERPTSPNLPDKVVEADGSTRCPQCGAEATLGLGCRNGSCSQCGWSGCN